MQMRQPDLVATTEVFTLRPCTNCGRNFTAPGKECVCPTCQTNFPPRRRRLSMRETQIVELVQQAKTNKEIAAELNLSLRTVEGHISRILDKKNLNNRVELALHVAAEKRPE